MYTKGETLDVLCDDIIKSFGLAPLDENVVVRRHNWNPGLIIPITITGPIQVRVVHQAFVLTSCHGGTIGIAR